jgi:hypothetical protein
VTTVTIVGACRRASISIAAITLLGGCGFLFTKGPPSGYESMNYFNCSEGRVGPTLDLVWAGLNIAGAAVVNDNNNTNSTYSTSQVRAIGLTEGLIWGASGIVGYGKVSRCRDAKQELADRTGNKGVRRRSPSESGAVGAPSAFAAAGLVSPWTPVRARAAGVAAPSAFSWTGLHPLSADLATENLPSRDRTTRDR